jgi:hypothetical protein
MKKTVRYLFLVALLFTVAGAFAVSCQKGGEEEVPAVGAGYQPQIQPSVNPENNTYIIEADGTTISATSGGYSFSVRARELTFIGFTCYLINKEKFYFYNDCNLTLHGDNKFTLANGGVFGGRHITLSGNGSITIKKPNLNVTTYNSMFSAAEGYTLTSSGKKDEGNGYQSCTWTVD